jgi:beta-lactamase class A
VRRALPLIALALVLAPAARAEAPALGGLVADLDRLRAYAGATDPALVQARYDGARALVEALARGEAPARCRSLARVLGRVARAHVAAAEGVDRLDDALRGRGERALDAALGDLPAAERGCPAAARLLPRRPHDEALLEPLDREAFFGTVRARVPAGAATVELRWRGARLGAPRPVEPGVFRTMLRGVAVGKGTLVLRFRDGRGALLATNRAVGAWRLPASAAVRPGSARRDPALDERLERAARSFPGWSGLYVLDLRDGRSGGWNEDARFPAASTVKLGVLAAALDRYGPRPERSPVLYDLAALAGRSSNLAANRLLRLLGDGDPWAGRAVVEERLRRLGTRASTYPGEYRVGTSARPRAVPGEPPPVSTRTTTAHDLGRILATLHAAAAGAPGATRASGLGRHEARVALSLLLDSQLAGANVGLLRPWLPASLPVAQKNGWVSDARHTAAVLYTAGGPVVVVCLTYRESLSLGEAQALGRRVLAAARVTR